MNEFKAFHSALNKTIDETSHVMSLHLKSEAEASKWPNHITSGLHVRYSKNGFEAHVSDKHLREAQDFEYGTPTTQPTAAIRRFGNRQNEMGTFLAGRLSHHLGEL